MIILPLSLPLKKYMILPEISEIQEYEKATVFQSTHLNVGALFEIPSFDLEKKNLNHFGGLLSSLPENWILKLKLIALKEYNLNSPSFRTSFFQDLGFLNRKIIFSIELSGKDPLGVQSVFNFFKNKKTPFALDCARFLEHLPIADLKALKAKALCKQETVSFLDPPKSQILREKSYLDFGEYLLGLIRLFRPPQNQMSFFTLSDICKSLPLPFEIVVSIKKQSRMSSQFWLNAHLKKENLSPSSKERALNLKEIIQESLSQSLFDVEWILLLKRSSESQLRDSINECILNLQPLGDGIMVETFGVGHSYFCSLFGAKDQHFTFKEKEENIPIFLPIFTLGEEKLKKKFKKRSLLLHREDESLHAFDLFDPSFLAFNALISGKTGSGKSAFGNMLSSSLLQDDDINMIKIDVGGSYKKECEIFQGKQICFSLDQPSGLNPFHYLKDNQIEKETISTLSELLSVLILEEGESSISKMMQRDIEKSLFSYRNALLESVVILSNIDTFLNFSKDFPRKSLLERWVSGGIFENALKSTESILEQKNRYRYFNFANIQSASQRDFSAGVMAAVIAEVNLEMLSLSNSEKKLVLFCDEVKFFIEKNSSFFLLTTANFRKFGHSVILLGQNIRDFEIKKEGHIDLGIILNSPIRIFFPTTLEEEYLRDQFNLSERQINALVRNPYSGKDYREAILQDDLGTRLVRLRLTKQEYWRITSSKEDHEHYQRIKSYIPTLTTDQILTVLSQAT